MDVATCVPETIAETAHTRTVKIVFYGDVGNDSTYVLATANIDPLKIVGPMQWGECGCGVVGCKARTLELKLSKEEDV